MATNATQGRYPKRKRAAVNYNQNLSANNNDLDFDDDGSDEGATAAAGSDNIAAPAVASQPNADANSEADSELEDATFDPRKTKKRKLKKKTKAKSQPVVKPKPPPKIEPFRLMDLPIELRLKIYEEALVDPHGVNIRTLYSPWEHVPVHTHPRQHSNVSCYVRGHWSKVPIKDIPKRKYQLSPNILGASKTIHEEAASLLWKQPFIFCNLTSLHLFLLLLRPESIAQLRDITILEHGWPNGHRAFPAFALLRQAPLLQNFRFAGRIVAVTGFARSFFSEERFGKRLAKKFYIESYPFVKELVKLRGEKAILDVFKFDRSEFEDRRWVNGRWVNIDWSQAREEKILEAMIAEIKVAMQQKITGNTKTSSWLQHR
ncbi:hypothetical protein diail_4480 [Diaporthe ilicicola]|nr:hypothetical protein diail_4480 [Diaporthe ilicicola]